MSIRPALRSIASPLLASLLASSPLAAQSVPEAPSRGFVARESISVTNIDVVVTDSKGVRVTGLKKEDFIVLEDKLEQVVTNFSPVEQGKIVIPAEDAPAASATAAPAAPTVAPPAPQAAPRTRIVFFVDNLGMAPFNRNRVLRNVETFVRDSVKDNVEGMIVAWNRSLKIRRKFTNDGRDLSDVFKQIEEESATGQQQLSDRRDVIQAIDDAQSVDQAMNRVRQYCQSLESDLNFTLDAMKTTIDQLSGVEGRKILVHVSDGMPQSPGAELWKYIDDKFKSNTGLTTGTFEFDRTTKYLGIVQAANASGVAIYTIDAQGLTVDSNVSAENKTTSQRIDMFTEKTNLQSMLVLMAEETGGRAALNQNNVLAALKAIEEDWSSYYSIGYRSLNSGVDRPHRIDVRMKKKGLTARARHSYLEKGVETKVREAVTSALFFPRDDNPLAVGLEIGKATPADRENFVVPVVIRIPYARLSMLPEGAKVRGRVVFYFLVIDAAGKQSDLSTQTVPIDIDAKRFEGIAQRDFIYDVKLVMIPGSQKLSVAVRDDVTNYTSFLQKSIFVSAFAGEESAPRR